MNPSISGLAIAVVTLVAGTACSPPPPDVSVVLSRDDCANVAAGVRLIDQTELGQLIGTSILSVDQPADIRMLVISAGPRSAGQRIGVDDIERSEHALNVAVAFEPPPGAERSEARMQQPCLVLAVGEPGVERITVQSEAGPIGAVDLPRAQ